MKLIAFVFFIMTLPYFAPAGDFSPTEWQPGWRLFAGGGLNSSLYSSEKEHIEGGVGLNLKTDLVYFFNDIWAVDWGSSVKFSRIDGFLLWDTQFTLGARRRLPGFYVWDYADPYVRVYIGKSPTVIFLDGNDIPGRTEGGDVNRLQFDGTVYGFALGNFAKTVSGTVWFTELSFTLQRFERESEIKMQGEVPIVTQERAVENNSSMYTITVSIGALVF